MEADTSSSSQAVFCPAPPETETPASASASSAATAPCSQRERRAFTPLPGLRRQIRYSSPPQAGRSSSQRGALNSIHTTADLPFQQQKRQRQQQAIGR